MATISSAPITVGRIASPPELSHIDIFLGHFPHKHIKGGFLRVPFKILSSACTS